MGTTLEASPALSLLFTSSNWTLVFGGGISGIDGSCAIG